MTLWLIVIGMGAATYAIRLSFLVFLHHGALPGPFRESLRFVAPAVLTAILVPAVLFVGENDEFVLADNERLPAALAAAVVAWLTKSVWLTIAVGMAALWLAKAIT